MDGSSFRELVSGRRRGITATGLRTLLSVLELPYTSCVNIRNALYDWRVFPTTFVEVPTIAVGNLTLGGTGKTPLVAWIAERLLEYDRRPGLISRGYKNAAIAGRRRPVGTFDDREDAASDAEWDALAATPVGSGFSSPAIAVAGFGWQSYRPDENIAHKVDDRERYVDTPHWLTMNDEGRELTLRLPGVPHVQNPDRIAAAREILGGGTEGRTIDSNIDCLILDDAFQHRRIGRDLNIVLIDALEPFGFEHVFPRGTLREPLAGLRRADLVLLSRADLLDEPRRNEIERRIRRFVPDVPYAEIAHVPQSLLSLDWMEPEDRDLVKCVSEIPLDVLRNRKTFAFCGIGNPAGFFRTLENSGAKIVETQTFPDHHVYRETETGELAERARAAGADAITCTVKDLVKIGRKTLGGIPLEALAIGIDFLAPDGEQTVRKLIQAAVDHENSSP